MTPLVRHGVNLKDRAGTNLLHLNSTAKEVAYK